MIDGDSTFEYELNLGENMLLEIFYLRLYGYINSSNNIILT